MTATRAALVLLVLCPVALVGSHVGWSPTLVFLIATIGTIPAAGLLGRATEEAASGITLWHAGRSGNTTSTAESLTLGDKIGGLLNATFGNIPELIIAGLAVQHGYIALAKASIIGSVLGNLALVLGFALLVGGIRNGVQRFDAQETGHHAVLMVLAVAGLLLPSVFLTQTKSGHVGEISVAAALLLLGTYLVYVAYSIFGVGRGAESESGGFIEDEARAVRELHARHGAWPLRRSVAVLALSTLLVFAAAEALVSSVGPFTEKLGWSPVFVGVIVVPIIGNIAEHSSAILLAYKNKMDVAFGVSSGSSIQVAVFVAPVLVLISRLGHPLDLTFSPIELVSLGLVVALFYLVSRDGESNWLEGAQLLILYALAATVYFYVPGQLG